MKQGLQEIITRIHQDAVDDSEAELRRLTEADEAARLRERQIAEGDYEKHHESLLKQLQLEELRLMERLQGRFQREVLEYQQELVDGIFNSAGDKLRAMSPSVFAALLHTVLQDLQGSYRLRLGAMSAHMLDAEAVAAISAQYENVEIRLSKNTLPHSSGFILFNDETEYNFIFEELLGLVKEEQGAAIYMEIFSAWQSTTSELQMP